MPSMTAGVKLMKKFFLLALILGALMMASTAGAATGYCLPKNGPATFTADATTTIDAMDNVVGRTKRIPFGGSSFQYSAQCDCDDTDQATLGNFYKADYLMASEKIGNNTFVVLNESLQLAVMIHVANYSEDLAVPFTDVWNKNSHRGCSVSVFSTGGNGSLVFRISKPFKGKMIIPATPVAAIFGTVREGQYSPEPMSRVYISGTITVPQSCELNAGGIVSVDYGTIIANTFRQKGQKPQGFNETRTTIGYVCQNISEGITLSMTLSGDTASGYPEALATSNSDVGIQIKDGNGNVLPVNTGELPMPVDLTQGMTNQAGSVDILSSPINLTGKTPQAGNFTASAAITVKFR